MKYGICRLYLKSTENDFIKKTVLEICEKFLVIYQKNYPEYSKENGDIVSEVLLEYHEKHLLNQLKSSKRSIYNAKRRNESLNKSEILEYHAVKFGIPEYLTASYL